MGWKSGLFSSFVSSSSALKSDHCGMEILILGAGKGYLYRVKIRPLWDGNYSVANFWRSSIKLKSDHCGMEIPWTIAPGALVGGVKIRPLWDGNHYNICEQKLYKNMVKIRPLWDGNRSSFLCSIISRLKSDHCGMEIILFLPRCIVSQLKSDHCGMEIFMLLELDFWLAS